MKKVFTTLAILFAGFATQVQSNFGIGTATPAASAALDVTSTSQGILVPRMTTTARNNISSPAKGLMVYDSILNGFYYHNGTAWSAINSGGSARIDLVVRKLSSTQLLPLSNANADIETYETVVTAPTIGSYSTANNAYTVGVAGIYLVQTRNSMIVTGSQTSTVGAYNWLEVNSAAIGSTDNIYPSFTTSVSNSSVMPSTLKSPTLYTIIAFLNAGDVIRIRATGANTTAQQTLNNDGGTQLTVIKL